MAAIARRTEVDLLRSLAILLMVIYHARYDLAYFYGADIAITSGGWKVLQVTTATLFLGIVGASFVLSAQRKPDYTAIWKRALIRSAVVLSAALLVTAVTYMLDPDTYIRFGILHCIGVSILLLPLLLPLKEWNALTGAALIGIGNSAVLSSAGSAWLLPLGYPPPDFTTLDYYPLLPWTGVVLIGLALGHLFYARLRIPQLLPPGNTLCHALALPGRHALLIYLLHQPLLLGVLRLI